MLFYGQDDPIRNTLVDAGSDGPVVRIGPDSSGSPRVVDDFFLFDLIGGGQWKKRRLRRGAAAMGSICLESIMNNSA
jgi:hypothetical protein